MKRTTSFLLLSMVWATAGWSQAFRLDSVGLGYGCSFFSKDHQFHQPEIFANWILPWRWEPTTNCFVQLRLGTQAGWLFRRSEEGFVGSLGPNLLAGHKQFPLSLEGGLAPTLLSRTSFGDKDFAIPLQFTSHVGLNWQVASHWRLGYRFQHMSNAGFGEHNPGLNLHMLRLGYTF